jgi:dihydropteroate synthase
MLDSAYLAEILETHSEAASAEVQEFAIGQQEFRFNSEPALMGVINLSTDSWYRESVCHSAEAAIRRGRILVAQGAQLVDVGAESTLAHAARADAEAQNSKLLPVIRGLREAGAAVSVETYQLDVARDCLEAGANVLNLTGTERGAEMYRMVADHEAAVIICYVQGKNVREVAEFEFGQDLINAMSDYFDREIDLATKNGVSRIFIDPGLGFYYRNLQDSSTRVRHQMKVFLNAFRFRSLGWPVCNALPHAAEYFGDEVRTAEPFFAVLAALGKTDLFRTHEIPKVKAVLDTMAAF